MRPVYTSTLLLILFSCSFASAQVSSSLRRASSHHSSSCRSSPGSSSRSSHSSSSMGAALPFLLVDAQKDMLVRRAYVPRIVSIEVLAPVGYNSSEDYYTVSPEVRANWGILTAGFRYFNLIEPRREGKDSWKTFDIDFLQFNLINSHRAQIRLGTGITVEETGGRTFQELIGGADLFFLRNRLFISQEGRFSFSYCNCSYQRKEYNAGLNLKLMGTKHFRMYGTFNFLIQNYYKEVEVRSIGGGLRFMVN